MGEVLLKDAAVLLRVVIVVLQLKGVSRCLRFHHVPLFEDNLVDVVPGEVVATCQRSELLWLDLDDREQVQYLLRAP